VFVQPRLGKIIAVLTVKELPMKRGAIADTQIARQKQAFRKQFENSHDNSFLGAAVLWHSRKILP
jgi:hypothetical protein